jgi:hypothetical protein
MVSSRPAGFQIVFFFDFVIVDRVDGQHRQSIAIGLL